MRLRPLRRGGVRQSEAHDQVAHVLRRDEALGGDREFPIGEPEQAGVDDQHHGDDAEQLADAADVDAGGGLKAGVEPGNAHLSTAIAGGPAAQPADAERPRRPPRARLQPSGRQAGGKASACPAAIRPGASPVRSPPSRPARERTAVAAARRAVVRGRKETAESAGLSVSELKAEMIVEAAMVKANWRKNCPVMPVMNAQGTNTALSTSPTAITGPETWLMALIVASRGARPCSMWCSTASTTTIASSTTMPMASTRPNSVRLLRLKPIAAITAKVPTIATGTAIRGMIADRQFCRNSKDHEGHQDDGVAEAP